MILLPNRPVVQGIKLVCAEALSLLEARDNRITGLPLAFAVLYLTDGVCMTHP